MLIEESSNPYSYLQFSALKRLSYYYPEELEPIAINLFHREPYDSDIVWNLIRNELVLENDETKWQTLLNQFKIKHGQNIYDSIPYLLHWIYWKTAFARDQKFLNGQKNAKIILDKFFPAYEFDRAKFFNASTINEFENIYKSLRHLNSSKINAAIHHFIEEAIKKNLIIPNYISLEFYAKVLSQEGKENYKEYLNKRVNELESLYQEKIRQEEKPDSIQMRSYYRKLIREYKEKLNLETKSTNIK